MCSPPPHISARSTARWGNPTMPTLKSVGWSGLSCFSLAIFGPGPGAEGTARQPKRANYTYGAHHIQVQLVFYSRDLRARGPARPGAALWKLWACRSGKSPHPHPSSMSGSPLIRWGACPGLDAPVSPGQLYSNHSTLNPPAPARSHMGWHMQPTRRARREATPTR